jgi:hypothetical protein
MKKWLLRVWVLLVVQLANAQEFGEIIKGGTSDAQRYLNNYMEPALVSFSNGVAGGWYNTAKTHKLFGVDLTMAVNLAVVPRDARSFTFRTADYDVFQLASGAPSATVPTAAGGKSNQELLIEAGTVVEGISYAQEERFSAPRGFGDVIGGVPTPTLTMGIGLPKNTDLKLRWVPSINSGGYQFDLWGVGVMHDLKQWIPKLKESPIDLAGFVGTTTMNAKVSFEDDQVSSDNLEASKASSYLKATATTIQVLASRKLGVFTPYAGVGYNVTTSSFGVEGTYVYIDDDGTRTDEIKDPISLAFKEGNSPRATVGFRVKLTVLTFHADYTLQKYSTLSAGLGVSVR